MKTVYTESPSEAAAFVRDGGVVAFATETVFGLGADATSERAVQKIFAAKGRPADNPLIVHLHSREQVKEVVRSVSQDAELLMDHFFPGPLSIILPKAASIPSVVSAGLDTIAVRMPAHPTAQQFLTACGVPVAAPSANLSGKPSPTTWQSVREDMDGRIDAVLTAGAIDHGIESTVIDCSGDTPLVLRAGSITLEQLLAVCPAVHTAGHGNTSIVKSPGTKYRHYSPQAEIVLVETAEEAVAQVQEKSAFLGLEEPSKPEVFDRVSIFENAEEYAKHIYETFRDCDRMGIERIICQTVDHTGIGRALNDRLQRAANG